MHRTSSLTPYSAPRCSTSLMRSGSGLSTKRWTSKASEARAIFAEVCEYGPGLARFQRPNSLTPLDAHLLPAENATMKGEFALYIWWGLLVIQHMPMRPPAARAYTPTALFGLDARCVWARYSSSFSLVAYPEQKRIAGSKAPCLRKSCPSSRSLST